MGKRFIIAALLAIALTATGLADQWNIDKSNSHVGFSAQHMLINHVPGQFNDFSGKVFFDGKNVAEGSAELTINMQSITTGNDRRDNHLRSGDFFDIENYPIATFKSTKIIPGDGDNFKMIGDLTIKGITKPVTLDCVFNGAITDPGGNTRAGFAASGSIKRHDFNIAWDNKLKDGTFIVGEDILLDIQAELIKQAQE